MPPSKKSSDPSLFHNQAFPRIQNFPPRGSPHHRGGSRRRGGLQHVARITKIRRYDPSNLPTEGQSSSEQIAQGAESFRQSSQEACQHLNAAAQEMQKSTTSSQRPPWSELGPNFDIKKTNEEFQRVFGKDFVSEEGGLILQSLRSRWYQDMHPGRIGQNHRVPRSAEQLAHEREYEQILRRHLSSEKKHEEIWKLIMAVPQGLERTTREQAYVEVLRHAAVHGNKLTKMRELYQEAMAKEYPDALIAPPGKAPPIPPESPAQMSSVRFSELQFPELRIPEVRIPSVEIPSVEMPSMQISSMQIPPVPAEPLFPYRFEPYDKMLNEHLLATYDILKDLSMPLPSISTPTTMLPPLQRTGYGRTDSMRNRTKGAAAHKKEKSPIRKTATKAKKKRKSSAGKGSQTNSKKSVGIGKARKVKIVEGKTPDAAKKIEEKYPNTRARAKIIAGRG